MRASKFDPALKQKAIQAIEAGRPAKEIEAETGVPRTTIANWKSELRKKNQGSGEKKRRRRKPNGLTVEEQLKDATFELRLSTLENEALRKIANEEDPTKRLVIEIVYLRKRLEDWGDQWVKALTDAADPAEES
jgi:transposase-like protein